MSIPNALYKVKDFHTVDAKSLFLQRLTLAMEARGLSQNALADRLSTGEDRVYASAVNNWLTKGTMPGGEMLIRLPAALDVDGHWLLTGEGSMERTTPEAAQTALERVLQAADEAREMIRLPHSSFRPLPRPDESTDTE